MQGPDLTGSVLEDRYRIFERLGVGGMGAVYRGEHVKLGSEVAVKVLLPKYAHDAEWVQRFLLEARAASRIRHPNIVQIHDFGAPHAGLVYMVMELLDGENFADLAKRQGPLPWSRVARICEQVAEALAAAHGRGIIHRDIKPANVFRVGRPEDPVDVVKVLDFGIAKFLVASDDDADNQSTATGILMGTPDYIAPEIFQGLRPDPRADVYSLGVMMYKLLTGRVPFTGGHIVIAQQIMSGRPAPPSQFTPPHVRVAPEVDALILRALRREREERTASMTELVAALRACRDAESSPPALPGATPPAVALPAPALPVPALPASALPPKAAIRAAAPSVSPRPPTVPLPLEPVAPSAPIVDSPQSQSDLSEESTLPRRGKSVPVEPITDVKPAATVLMPAEVPTDRAALPPGIVVSSPSASRPSRVFAAVAMLVTLAGAALAVMMQTSGSGDVAALRSVTPDISPAADRPADPVPSPSSAPSLAADAGESAEHRGVAKPADALMDPDGTGAGLEVVEPVVAPAVDAGPSPAVEAGPSPPVDATAKKTSGGSSSARKKIQAGPPKDKPLAAALSSAAIVRLLEGMDARLQSECFQAHKTLGGTTVRVSVTVDASGRAVAVPNKPRSTSFVGCVATQIEKYAFPQTQTGGSAQHTFTAQ